MKAIRQIKSLSLSETRWLAYATAGVAGAFGLSSSAEAEIHYSGNVFIALTGYARASLPLSNGASNVSAGRFGSVAGNPGYGVLIANWSDGAFAPPEFERLRGFVGFRFYTGNGTQYGWARIQTKDDNNHRIHDVIRDYAWGDVGDVILTGQTQSLQQGNADSVSGSLGLLAFGAQGLEAWRAQRTQKSN